MDVKSALILSLVLVLSIIVLLAYHPAWFLHLHTDINVYLARTRYFLNHGDFVGLVGNEYQPGALIFFIAISPFLLINDSLGFFIIGLFLVNISLIFILAYLYKKYSDIKNIFFFALILFFTGPIALYRFDLYVMTMVITSFYLFGKNSWNFSSAILAYASFIKIFPIIFLPYYLIIASKNNGYKAALKVLSVYFISYLAYLSIFSVVFGMKFSQIISSFDFIANTPVHTESLWGTLTSLYWMLSGESVKGLGSWGIFGISPNYQIGPLWFYNYFWMLPIFLFYLWLSLRKNIKFDIKVCITVVLLFLLFSKILHHQYTLWFMLLLPLLNFNLFLKDKRFLVLFFLVLEMTFLNQFVYPLHYSQWVFELYLNGKHSYLFWLITLRNLVLVTSSIFFFIQIKNRDEKYENS